MTTETWETRFNEFWKLYPARNGVRTGKAVARKAWLKIKGDDALFETIIKALMWNLHSNDDWTRDNGQFIPMGSTWLNQKRWEDYVDANPVGVPEYVATPTDIAKAVDGMNTAVGNVDHGPSMTAYANASAKQLTLRQKYLRFRGIKVGV
jgi:hypothetical protein